MTRRLFVPRARLGAPRVPLSPEDRHYLRHVLRLAPGAEVEVFDGEGGAHAAHLSEDGEALLVGERRTVEAAVAPVHLAFALARGERCDWVVQKATELGVTRLTPFAAARSVVRLGGARGEERTGRWRRIAADAARQCGRADVPEVDVPSTLDAALAAALPGARIVVPYEGGGEPLDAVVDPAAPGHVVVVGPEGGFAPEEIRACLARGGRLATLGPRILRFETAAIVAIALVQHLLTARARPPTTRP